VKRLGRGTVATLCLLVSCRDRPTPSHRGLYLGGDLNVFSPCGDAHVYWVQAADTTLRKLRGAQQGLAGSIARPIYIEVRGRLLPGRGQAEYHGTFQIDTLLAVSGRRPLDCTLPRGSGKLDPDQ